MAPNWNVNPRPPGSTCYRYAYRVAGNGEHYIYGCAWLIAETPEHAQAQLADTHKDVAEWLWCEEASI